MVGQGSATRCSLIAPPPPSGRLAAAAALVTCAALGASGVLGAGGRPLLLALVAVCIGAAWRARDQAVLQFGVVVVFTGVAHHLLGRWWPLPTVITLLGYGLALAASPRVRTGAGWLRRGRLDRAAGKVLAFFVVCQAIALVLWRYTTSADLDRFRALVPDVPIGLVAVGLVAVAIINAAYEELLWRGLAQHALEAATGSRWAAWLLQGIGFGFWHYEGFPSGPVGATLAGVFALMMGYLRLRYRGMLAPFLAHVCADVTIFVLIAIMVL